jgi:hypothetical protein
MISDLNQESGGFNALAPVYSRCIVLYYDLELYSVFPLYRM